MAIHQNKRQQVNTTQTLRFSVCQDFCDSLPLRVITVSESTMGARADLRHLIDFLERRYALLDDNASSSKVMPHLVEKAA